MPLYEVEFSIIETTTGEKVHGGTVQAVAEHEEAAKGSVTMFVREREPRYAACRKPSVRIVTWRLLDDGEALKPLLILMGGTSEVDIMLKRPSERFSPGLVIVRLRDSYREIAYISGWLDELRWTGFRWHAQRKRWIAIPRASASEIIGEALSCADGDLLRTAKEALRNLPK